MTSRFQLGLVLALPLLGCHPTRHYESVVQIVHMDTVETDEKGNASLVDVELEWDPCPGDQFQVVRGGKEFAACMAKHEKGELLPILVTHQWDERGYYNWAVTKVGECGGDIDGQLEGSYEKSQECREVTQYGSKVGFECSRRPFRDLVAICPWTARE